jgi:hypothetical protein
MRDLPAPFSTLYPLIANHVNSMTDEAISKLVEGLKDIVNDLDSE